MKRLRTLIGITLCIISFNLKAQFNNSDYFLIKNQRIEDKDARRLVIKITSDSTYEFVDNSNHSFKIDNKTKKIEFPLNDELSNFSIHDGKIEIKTNEETYAGTTIDIDSQKEKEYFKYLLVDLNLPVPGDSDSLINSLDEIATMRNSETLYLSYHQKSLYPRHDKNGSCIIQFDDLKTSVCDIDNQCTMSGVHSKNKDLLFRNRIKDYQRDEDFIFILFIDKDVNIKDINTTIKAIRKVDNLSKIYFALESANDEEYAVNYKSIPIDIDLNDRFTLYADWINADMTDKFIRGERIMIIEDDVEIKDDGYGIIE